VEIDRYATSPEGLGRFMRTSRICNQMKRGPIVGLAAAREQLFSFNALEVAYKYRDLADVIKCPRNGLLTLVMTLVCPVPSSCLRCLDRCLAMTGFSPPKK
jgi:hypothetical protein